MSAHEPHAFSTSPSQVLSSRCPVSSSKVCQFLENFCLFLFALPSSWSMPRARNRFRSRCATSMAAASMPTQRAGLAARQSCGSVTALRNIDAVRIRHSAVERSFEHTPRPAQTLARFVYTFSHSFMPTLRL